MKRLVKIRSGPVIVKRQGAHWLLYPRDWIDNRLYIGRPFEREQLEYAKSCIKRYNVSSFYDCGSNIGLYSVILGLQTNQLKEIHAFEPVPQTWGRLVSNLMLNELNGKVVAHNYGLGVRDESLEISIDSRSTGTATLSDQTNSKRNFDHQISVDIRIFDDQFTNHNQDVFMKMDLEGFELNALKGMAKFFRNNRCILQIELWEDNRAACFEFLESQGYEAFNEIGSDFYFKKTVS